MNWMRSNDVQQGVWSQRTTRSHRSYNSALPGDGVSIEDIVLVSNLAGVAPWFSIPYNADAHYITSFAELVKTTLRPDVNVYVEYRSVNVVVVAVVVGSGGVWQWEVSVACCFGAPSVVQWSLRWFAVQ